MIARRLTGLFIAAVQVTLAWACKEGQPAGGPGPQVITVQPGVTYQTMNGWEATAQAGQWECAGFSNYKNQLYDTATHDLGINRLRVAVTSGSENPTDYFAQFRSGLITFPQWMQHAYEIVNDNNDPSVINASGFHFSALDEEMDSIVLPIRQRLQARGEQLYINLNYTDFGDSTLHRQNPAEYAEFMVAVFQHLQSKYGFVPNAIEVVLEPDNTGAPSWTATQIGNAISAAGDRLKSLGFGPDFIAPSNASMAGAVTYFDQLIQVPGASNYVKELSYHRYNSVSDASLLAIGSRAQQRGIRAAMLEHIGSGYDDLYKDLTLGRNSAWQQYSLAFCTSDNGAQYYTLDTSNPSAPVVNIGSRTKFLRQYFKFVRRGAVRIGATSNDATFNPVAFINTNGKYVLVVNATAGGPFSVGSLPAGTYGIKYTTGTQYDVNAADATLGAGAALNTSIPASGVITIYAK